MSKGFTCKQFHIDTSECGMPVSTDGILLGAWANIEKAETILDIGCGAGLLSIMCAQRNSDALITGIDIEINAVNAAKSNCEQSPWKTRLMIEMCSLQRFVNKKIQFTAVICNPPYFNNGERSQQTQRALARHTESLSHQRLLNDCHQVLEEGGKASFILPATEGFAFIELLNHFNQQKECPFAVSRLTKVYTTQKKPVSRLLIELTKVDQDVAITTQQASLFIHQGEGFSDAFITLTKDFYLKM